MASPADVSLEQYAKLRRALRGRSDEAASAILAESGVTRAAWEIGRAHWARELERDAAGGDGELLIRFAAACEADDAESSDASSPPSDPAKPEVRSLPEPVPAGRSFEIPSHLLPSKGPKSSPWIVAPPPPPKPSGGSATVEPPSVDASPAPTSARFRAEWQPPSSHAPLPPPSSRASVSALEDEFTSMADDDDLLVSKNATLPFSPGARGHAPRPIESAAPKGAPRQPRLHTGTIDFKKAALDLEQFAWIQAELVTQPHDHAAIRARYGMSRDDDWDFAQTVWRERFKRDSAMHRKWWEKYHANCEWLRSRGAPPQR